MNFRKLFQKFCVVAAMSATITMTAPMVMPATPTTVVSAATVKLNKKNLSMVIGDSTTLKVNGAKSVKWSSSNKKVATVSSKGKVKAVASGTAVITAKAGKKKLTCKVTVAPFQGEELTLDSGATFVVPKGWTVLDASQNGVEIKAVKQSDQVNSSIVFTVIPMDQTVSAEEFIEQVEQLASEERQKTLLMTQTGMKLDTEEYTQKDFKDDAFAGLVTYMKFSAQGTDAIEGYVADLYDGETWYEISGNNLYDTDIDIIGYTKYIIQMFRQMNQ